MGVWGFRFRGLQPGLSAGNLRVWVQSALLQRSSEDWQHMEPLQQLYVQVPGNLVAAPLEQK